MEKKVGKKVPKHLDDDEDRKNPAYIPRKGLFFEHDLRGQTQEEEVRYVSVPLGLWEGQASFQASLWQQGSLLQWDALGRSVLLLPALCYQHTSALCFEGEMQKKALCQATVFLELLFPNSIGSPAAAVQEEQEEGGLLPVVHSLPQKCSGSVCGTAQNGHILALQPLSPPCVPFLGQRAVSGSCGRMRGVGNTTSSVRMSRPPRPGRS